jgi:hypothetical protein
MNVTQYTKSIVTILAAGLGIFTAAITDGVVTPLEYVNVVIAILTAVGVYLLPNLPEGVRKYTKTLVAFGGAAATALAVIVADAANFGDIGTAAWLSVLLAGLAAIGVYVLPNIATNGGVNISTTTPHGGPAVEEFGEVRSY